jgi:hypothetical protein
VRVPCRSCAAVLPESAILVDSRGVRRVHCDVCGSSSRVSPLLAALIAPSPFVPAARVEFVDVTRTDDD